MEPGPGVERDFDEEALMRDAAIAERNRSMRERGRQIGGTPGAVMAGMMIALRDIYESPKRDNGSVVVDSPSEPHDVDRDGLELRCAPTSAATPTSRSPRRRVALRSSPARGAAAGADATTHTSVSPFSADASAVS